MTLLHDDELRAYSATLKKYRIRAIDFRLEEGNSEGSEGGSEGLPAGTVTVTYKCNGKARQYATGPGSRWPRLFERDVRHGRFVF
jgi:hypothetical protein